MCRMPTAQALVSRRTKAIGLVLTRSQHHIATDAFLPKIISGLLTTAKKHNIRILMDWVETEHQESAYFELARAKRIDGMILSTPRLNDAGAQSPGKCGYPHGSDGKH
jgi:DNA-binding LacI/PurR family transcriptional regulator